MERRSDKQRDGQGPLQGEPFWRQFSEDDLQERGGGKADGEGGRFLKLRRGQTEPLQGRSQQRKEDGFRQPAQTETGHRDVQLGGAEVGGEVLQNVPGQARPPVPGDDQGVELGVAQLDKGEFGRDKKAVDQNNGQNAHQV